MHHFRKRFDEYKVKVRKRYRIDDNADDVTFESIVDDVNTCRTSLELETKVRQYFRYIDKLNDIDEMQNPDLDLELLDDLEGIKRNVEEVSRRRADDVIAGLTIHSIVGSRRDEYGGSNSPKRSTGNLGRKDTELQIKEHEIGIMKESMQSFANQINDLKSEVMRLRTENAKAKEREAELVQSLRQFKQKMDEKRN